MSKKIKVSLSSTKSKKKLSLDNPSISLGDGFCKFPFNFKGEKYNECYKGKKGDWCATVVDKKQNMKKYAYCDYSANSPNVPKAPNTSASKPPLSKKKTFKKKTKKSPLDSIPPNLRISKSEKIIRNLIKSKFVALTHSCTAALEISAILIDLKKGDEVILPSYGFVSIANAIVLRGAKPVFVEINPHDLNISLRDIKNKTSKKNKGNLRNSLCWKFV